MEPLKESIEQYKDIYSQLYSALKWKVDKQFLMLIAAMYGTSKKPFHLKAFLEIADYIKDNVGLLSQLKSSQRYTVAATLDTTTDDPKSNFHYLLTIYENLIEKGFSRCAYSYISAGTLLKVEPNRIDEMVQKTLEVYKGMRKNHMFLTGYGDYPFAAILAQHESGSEEIMDRVEEYYRKLSRNGFSIGNDLQFLSHILALDPSGRPDEKAAQCAKIIDLLRDNKLKAKRTYYPYIGMLSFIDNVEGQMANLYEINSVLNHDFKWHKDTNFMVSVLFLINQFTSVGDAARTGLTISIEAIIQAQQAAMTASIAASVAASNSSSSS